MYFNDDLSLYETNGGVLDRMGDYFETRFHFAPTDAWHGGYTEESTYDKITAFSNRRA